MAENDPTIELPAEGGTDNNENRDKPDLRRSLRKQQVMIPLRVDRTNSRPETRTSSKTKHDANKDPEKLDLGGSGHNEGKNPMQLHTGKIILSLYDIHL